MDSTALWVLLLLATAVGAYWLGQSVAEGTSLIVPEHRVPMTFEPLGFQREENGILYCTICGQMTDPEVDEHALSEVRFAAFGRAAHAVSMHGARVDRRGELVRHLLSLADAPELGARTPNPEATTEVESPPTDSPVPSAAPVPAAPAETDTPTGGPLPEYDEPMLAAYRAEGGAS